LQLKSAVKRVDQNGIRGESRTEDRRGEVQSVKKKS